VSKCVDRSIGQLLHDYELGFLSDEARQRFELHLYDCDHCLKECRSFADVSQLISDDSEARELISRLVAKDSPKKTAPSILKFLLAAALMCVLAIPTYWYGFRDEKVGTFQTLELLPSRAGGSNIIYFADGGDVRINFHTQSNTRDTVDLLISNINGDTVLFDPGFSDFNEWGLGTIELPVDMFAEGHYSLLLSFPTDSTDVHHVQYMFRVK